MTMASKRKAPGKLTAPVVSRSARNPYKTTIDESKTSVSRPDAVLPVSSVPETIEISSDPGSDDEDISDAEEEYGNSAAAAPPLSVVNGQKRLQPQVNGTPQADGDADESSVGGKDEEEGEEEGEGTSPSFGELLRGNDAIDVAALLQQQQQNPSSLTSTRTGVTAGGRRLRPAALATQLPSHQSLTTVLTQALRTDDVDMLELCLDTPDTTVVRNTVEGIDSALAGTLLSKLAARLYRKPGRAGSLMLWVQWTLIAHGGALASQPKIVQGLGGLQKVLAERSRGLNSLLALKGKLDLLEGQMNIRRSTQRRRRGGAAGRRGADEEDEDDDDVEDEDVIYVEGEADNSSEKALSNGHRERRGPAADEDADEAESRLLNGGIADSSDDEDDSDAGEYDDDDEDAQESLDEDEVDHDDVDDGADESMGEDEESDVEAAPPSKVQKVGRSFPKRR